MKVNIEIIGDDSEDPDRLMKSIREAISYWGTTNTEEYARAGVVEKTTIDITKQPPDPIINEDIEHSAKMREIADAFSRGALTSGQRFKL